MKNALTIAVFLMVSTLVAFPFLKKELNNENISISVTENAKSLKITADFPKSKSQLVHQLIENKLNIKDLDLTVAEVRNYVTSDKLMQIFLESENDYLKIELEKRKNSKAALVKLKAFGEDLKMVLADKKP